MDKKDNLNLNQTPNKINLNKSKNKSVLLTINYNHKPHGVFKPKVNKIGRKPSKLKFKKRNVQEDEQTELIVNQPEGIEEIVVEEDDLNEEEEDDDNDDEGEEDDATELPNEDDQDKLREKIEKHKQNKTQKQPRQKTKPPGKGGNNPPSTPTNPSGTPGSGGIPANPPATPPVAPTAAAGGTTAAAGGTTAAAGGTTAAAGGIAAAIGTAAIIIIILLVIIVIIAIIIVIVGGASSEQTGYYTYGTTCTTITVENPTNPADVGQVSIDDYIAGVVAAEIGETNNIELYKTAAIVERTYILNNISSTCTVEGNSTFKEYVDIENHSHKDIIKQSVEETKKLVLVENGDLIDSSVGYGYIESQDNTYYYIGYGYNSLSGSNKQAIPKAWISEKSLTDKISSSSKNYDISIVGAMYLIENEGYSHEDVISYYYGETVEITENTMILSGANGFLNPTPTLKCTSAFGYRIDPVSGKADAYHSGIDIGVSEPIYAAKSGTISYVLKNVTVINAKESNAASGYGYGNYISIDHGDGTLTLYAHIKYGSIPDEIYSGATVEQGQQIGHTGSTGRSTGVHLHYEVRVNGERVDPADYLDLTNATGTCRR